jgi:hypothetical protein
MIPARHQLSLIPTISAWIECSTLILGNFS